MKLQNNYTTPEQSKRLLELGLPADSADCGIVDDIMHGDREILQVPYSEWCAGYENISIPCWSVGRLIEIFLLCTPYKEISLHNENLAEQMVVSIFMVHKDNLIDFSKLED